MSSSDEICIVLPSDGEIESANGLERASRKKSSSKGSRSRSRSKGARRKSPSKGSRSKSPSKGLRSESPSKGSRSKSPSKASSSSVKGQPDPVPITIEEIEYREKSFAGLLVQKLKLLCTTCGKNLELSIPQAYQIASHPILDVLLCKTCADFYGEGDFSVDEDGTDKYCRWCGQGGTLYLCSDCNFGFCRACIKRNLHRSVLNDVNADDWKCFSCDSKPLWELRGICAATLEYIRKRKEKMKEEKLLSKSLKKAMISTSESESDTNSMKERRKKKRKIRRSPSVEKNERKKQKKEDKTFKKESSHVEAKTVKYSKNLDRKSNVNVQWAEKLLAKYEEHTNDFFDVVSAISSEAKKVFKEKKISVQKMQNFEARYKMIKGMIELRDLSCKSISQVCENFFLTYRNTIECCNSEVCANDDNISKSDESCVENATAGKQISKNDESCEENASPGTLPSEVRESVGEVSMDEKTSVSNSDETARKVVSKEDKDDSSEDEVKTNDDLTGTISVKDVEKENNVNVKPNNKENDGDTSDTDIEIENSRQNNLNRKENESLNNCSEGNDLSSDQDNDICPRQESENCEEDSDIGLKSKKKNKKNNKKKISNKDNSRNKNSVVSDCEDFGERKRKVKKSANCNSDYENDTEDFGKDENLAICNSDKNNDSEKEKDSVSCNSDENHEDGDAENFEKVVESDSCNSDKSGEDGDAEEFKKDKDIASCNTDKNNEDCDTEIPIEDKVLASGNLENEEDCNTDVLDKNELSANCNSDTKNSIDSENENVEEKLVATSCNSGRTRLQSDNSIRLDDIDMNSIQCNDRDDSNSLHSMNKMVDKGDDNFPDIQFDGVISDLISSLSNDSQNNCKESVSNENDKDGKDLMVPPDSKSEAYSESSEKKGSLLGKDICVKNKKCTEELTDSLNNLAEEQISIDKHNRESSSNNGPLSIKESSDDSQSDAETVILSTENISANEMTGNEIEKENSELSASFGKTGNAKKIHIFSKKPSRSKNSKPHNIDKRDKNKMKNNKGIKKPVCDNSNTELCIPDDNENKSNIKNYQGAKSEGSDSDENSDNKITKEKQAMLALLLSSSDDEIYIKEEYSNNNLDDSDSESLKSSSSKGKSFPCEEKEVSHADDSSHHSSNMTISANSDERQASSKIGFNNQVRNCIVLVEKLAEDVFQKHFVDSNYLQESKKKKPTEKAQIDRLVNLKTLEASNKKKVSSASESESNQGRDINSKKTVKKEVKKKEKETLKDFHNSDSDGGSNHSDVSENSDEASSTKGRGLRNILEDLSKKNNKIAKELLLRSSSSDSDEETNELSLENKEKTKDKVKKVKVEKKEEEETTKTKEEISDSEEKMIKKGKKDDADSDDSDEIVKKKAAWRNDKLLRMKLSESDTSDDERRWEAKQLREAKERNESESDGPHLTKMNRKKTKRRRIVQSDSDVLLGSSDSSDTDSDEVFEVKSKRKRKRSSGSDKSKGSQSESETDKEEKKKPKRRRIRKPASDSSDSDGGSKNVNNSQKSDGTPNKGRKNIRRVLKEDDVADETRKAAKEEEERRKRIIEKQKMYNELYSTPEIETAVLDKLVLDFNPETKKELVEVHEALVKQLKPHQVKGIKFMWDACFESLELLKKNNGSGCILAHCMGLGKTLQVITLVHTLLSNPKTKVKTVMVVCPLSTVLNWISEFSKWLDQIEDNDIEVYELTKYKQVYERVGVIKQWQTNGGVMVIGYNLYRTLTCDKSKRQKKRSRESLQEALVDPGPDLVVCDEGHLLKNEGSALSKAMNLLRTRRRIVLTGTPLQNNLLEYHCMVQFVKPNLLGTKKEFLNRFVNPINNGQYENSTAHDVKIMKRRAHVLHKMLDSSVQRYDYSVLTPFLPPKFEYALSIRLTELQIKLYRYYLDHIGAPLAQDGSRTRTATLFKDYQALSKVWTHPRVLLMNSEKVEKKRIMESSDSEGSLRDFIADSDSNSDSKSSDSDIQSISGEEDSESNKKAARKPRTRSRKSPSDDEDKNDSDKSDDGDKTEFKNPEDWWRQFITDDAELDDIRQSGKLCLLFTLLDECEKIGDKVLVFSQSLFSLDLIEYFLAKIDEANQAEEEKENLLGFKASWSLGLDYFRLDGSSSAENRSAWCKAFNRENNLRARLFLISTRAGGLGINLVAANRVVIFDASWNPSHDLQSIFRVYRFGQKKPCYIYRFLAQATMEDKIYNRQVTKLSLACRVVDEQQIERHYNMNDLQELYIFNPEEKNTKATPLVPKDVLLAELVRHEDTWIISYHEHDTLLENKEEEELNEEERKAAWEDYEKEKQGLRANVSQFGDGAFMAYLNTYGFTEHAIRENIIQKNPHFSELEVQAQMSTVLRQLYAYVSSEAYQRQIQYKRQTQPVYLQNPQMQPQSQVNIQPQMTYAPVPNMSNQLLQHPNMQSYPMEYSENKTLDKLMLKHKENSKHFADQVPGTSATNGTMPRIQVKNFAHSKYTTPSTTPYMNPFASDQFSYQQKGGGNITPQLLQVPPNAATSSTNPATDVIDIE